MLYVTQNCPGQRVQAIAQYPKCWAFHPAELERKAQLFLPLGEVAPRASAAPELGQGELSSSLPALLSWPTQ